MNSLSLKFLKPKIINVSLIRTCFTGGKEYPGFTYYPRHKDFKDPPYTPSKLFLVRRIKYTGGVEEKKCIRKLNFMGKARHRNQIAIIQNTPENNALLWKIKHLIDIKPIFWQGELPTDGLGTFLRKTGELVISPLLKVTEESLELSQADFLEKHKIDRKYMKTYLLKEWRSDY